MDAGECSKPCEPSASSPAAAGGVWAKLVPADSTYPEVEVADDDTVVCSLSPPPPGRSSRGARLDEIRRAGDASSATIRNLRFWENRKINQGSTLCLVQVMKSTVLIFRALNVVLNFVDLDAVQEQHTCTAMDVEE